MLEGFPDPRLVPCLKYGFPLGANKDAGSSKIPQNHKGARDFPDEMNRILKKELDSQSIIGPFESNPLPGAKFSPLNLVAKKNTTDRRLILDLSHPDGFSINDGIDKDNYLNITEKLVLPSVDALADRVKMLGRGALLYKVDLARGYRQFKYDPGCVHQLGYVYKGKFYFDISLAMGSKSSARCCQMVTTGIVFICTKFGYFAVNYLDDIAGADTVENATAAFNNLRYVLREFGLTEASAKTCHPAPIMSFLGVEVNSLNMTLRIPDEKWEEIQAVLASWKGREKACLKDVQKLTGLLNFACRWC